MPLQRLHVRGYRSLRDFLLPLGQVNIITGANGTGKSNLYQSLTLVAQAAAGSFARAVSLEGGTPSLFWAGGERIRYTKKKPPHRFELAVDTDTFRFSFAAGLPPLNSLPLNSLFGRDPQVKDEKLWLRSDGRDVLMMDRGSAGTVWVRNQDSVLDEYAFALLQNESALSQIQDPHRYPELSVARQQLLAWRFYHQFRTDAFSPLRQPQPGVYTGALSQDGTDLAAALETILEVGDENFLSGLISRAFRGGALEVSTSDGALFSVSLRVPHILRPLTARELSDGQLRFLCLCAALLSPRPPSLIALNEPESSLHPDLYAPLAELIERASKHSQVWVTTHARPLAAAIGDLCSVQPVELCMVEGETRLASDANTPRRPHTHLRFGE